MAFSGILYNDTTERYPIFYIDHRKFPSSNEEYITKIIFGQRNTETFKGMLGQTEWTG